MRDLYWTFRNFRNRVTDFLRYRRVTANMDERFAEATPEDLARADNVCPTHTPLRSLVSRAGSRANVTRL